MKYNKTVATINDSSFLGDSEELERLVKAIAKAVTRSGSRVTFIMLNDRWKRIITSPCRHLFSSITTDEQRGQSRILEIPVFYTTDPVRGYIGNYTDRFLSFIE